MNFKDTYKSMTDEIQPDEKLLERILNGEKKNRKPFVLPVKSVYTAALAAMFIIVAGTVYYKSGIDSHMPAGESFTGYQEEAVAPQPSEIYIETEKSGGNTSENLSTPKDTYISDTATPPASKKEAVPKEAVSDEANWRDGGEATEEIYNPESSKVSETEKEEIPMSVADAVEEGTEPYDSDSIAIPNESHSSKASSGGGGGGSSSSAYSDIAMQTLDISEYWEYIGFDITSRMTLPHNMEFFVPQSATVKINNGKVTQDVLSISAASPDGTHSLYLTISKIRSQRGTVSVTFEGVHIGICSDSLSETELSDILSSIK